MNVQVKKINTTSRELKFEVDQDKVKKTFDEVYKDLGRVAKVKGFRQGKIPRNILEKHHSKAAEEEVIKKLIPEAYQEGLEKESLNPIDYPSIEDVDLKNGILTFTAKLELKPDVNVKDYKGIKVKRKDSKVTDEEINKTLEYFKQGQGKEGEEVKLDDSFAKGLGYPSMEDFKKSLSRQIEMDKDRQNRADVENQIVDDLIKKTKFDVPQVLVEKQLARRVDEQLKHLKSHGLSEEETIKKKEDVSKELRPLVEKDVKAYLIFDKIAQLEELKLKEGENLPTKVMEFLMKEAEWIN